MKMSLSPALLGFLLVEQQNFRFIENLSRLKINALLFLWCPTVLLKVDPTVYIKHMINMYYALLIIFSNHLIPSHVIFI